jgi:hypothetical protein
MQYLDLDRAPGKRVSAGILAATWLYAAILIYLGVALLSR